LARREANGANRPLRRARPTPRVENLEVVLLDGGKGGRYILR
jgi:hypothetical protein